MNVVELNTALALARAGHRVDMLTRRDSEQLAPLTQVAEGVRLFALDVGPRQSVAKSAQEQFIEPFTQAMRQWWSDYGKDVDIIHSHHWFSGVAALPIADEFGVPHAQSYHSVAAPVGAELGAGEQPESSGRIEGERLVAQQSDLIIAVSDYEKQTIIDRYDPAPEKFSIVRPGVDLELFRPKRADEIPWRGEECYLLFAARLQPLKGVDLALRTLAELPRGNRPKLVIAGEASADFADYVAELNQLTTDLELTDEVVYLGSLDRAELADMFRGACVLVNPSHSETYGLINLEAAASGVPVVASKTSGIVESVIDGQTGILVDGRDPKDFAAAVQQFSGSAMTRAQYGQAAREFAEQRSWDNVAAEMSASYELVLGDELAAEDGAQRLLTGLAGRPECLDGLKILMFHAHPDDEALQSGALIAELAARGALVDVVTATRGERGEVVAGVLSGDVSAEQLVDVRIAELAAASEILGVREHYFLGAGAARADGLAERRYLDSGMRWIADGLAGPAEDQHPDSFSLAPQAAALADLLALITHVQPEVLISYDQAGSYGHPDHVRVHEIGAAAAHAAAVPLVEIASDLEQPGFEYSDFNQHAERLIDALRCYRTQLTVNDGYLTHVGGQRQELPMTIGLRIVD